MSLDPSTGWLSRLLHHIEDVWAAMLLLGTLVAIVRAMDAARWPAVRDAVAIIVRVGLQASMAGAVVMLLVYDLDISAATKGAVVGMAAVFGELTLEALYQGVVRPLLERIGLARPRG